MSKGRDFYGTEIAEVIEQACKELGLPREQLDIAVLETGSTGIFGLCKKKAHIRVQVKKGKQATEPLAEPLDDGAAATPQSAKTEKPEQDKRPSRTRTPRKRSAKKTVESQSPVNSDVALPPSPAEEKPPAADAGGPAGVEEEESAAPAPESLAAIEDKLRHLLGLMGLPSTVAAEFTDNTILCRISGEHETYLAGQDGKILDSLQYLLRKMIGVDLPERVTLSLDAGGYREQRLARLQEQAMELAAQVRQSGKTKAIAGLNPMERRAVHLALQQDGEIRSRSVGSGLFKKILIYKAGKDNKPASSKRRSGAGERQDKD